MTTTPSDLLDAKFVRQLEVIRRRLEVRARSGAAGEHAARRRGGTAEFQEHRAYAEGDDLRRVDWAAFARTGEPVLKLFRSEEDAVVRLLLDGSASLDFGDPSKIDFARRLAAAFGYMALAGSQRAQILVARSDDSRLARGSSLARIGTPRRGRAGVAGLLQDLVQARAHGNLDLARAIDQVVALSRRPGLLVPLSDFFDGGPVLTALTRAAAAGHDVALVQVVNRSEVQPHLEGDYTLEDAETGKSVDVTMDPSAIEAYVLRFAGLVEELRGWCRKHGASYVRAITDEPLEDVVRRFVARTVD
jgi:uncharacterized protein (DUF58 family)